MTTTTIVYISTKSIGKLMKFLDELEDSDYSLHTNGADEPELWLDIYSNRNIMIEVLTGEFLNPKEAEKIQKNEDIEYIVFYA